MKTSRPIQQTLWDIQKKWGDGAIRRAADLAAPRAFSTGFETLDQALHARGIALNHLTGLVRTQTSGATTCACHVVAGGQQKDGFAVWIDTTGSFDPEMASRLAVYLPHLLVLRAGKAAQSIEIARDILKARAASALVIDLGTQAAAPGLRPAQFMDAVLHSDCAVVLLLDGDSPTWREMAHAWLVFERAAWLMDEGRITGYQSRVTLARGGVPGGAQTVLIDIPAAEMTD
jgi:hypothetical protein